MRTESPHVGRHDVSTLDTVESRPLIGVTHSSTELADFGLWRLIFRGIVAAGGVPVALDCSSAHDGVEAWVGQLDGVLIGGGGDVSPALYAADSDDPVVRGVNPVRDAEERRVLATAWESDLPVLAICRGFQFVNVELGGSLVADLVRDRPSAVAHEGEEGDLVRSAHVIRVLDTTLVSEWMNVKGEVAVNSQHHQGIDALGEGLVPVAWAEDGLVEAYEATARRLVGVQWHPEISWPFDSHSMRLLQCFVAECHGRDDPKRIAAAIDGLPFGEPDSRLELT